MTSVRPKLKPETPKAITAWGTQTGEVVWMTQDHDWTGDVGRLGVFTGEAAEVALAHALGQQASVTDPYFMEVTSNGAITGRETLREMIRANGPTVPYGASR